MSDFYYLQQQKRELAHKMDEANEGRIEVEVQAAIDELIDCTKLNKDDRKTIQFCLRGLARKIRRQMQEELNQ